MRSIKFTAVSQVDAVTLQQYVSDAAQLTPSPTQKPARELNLPPDLIKVLAQPEPAYAAFQKLSYTHRKEFVVWLEKVKKPETRTRRLQQVVEQLTEKSKSLPK